MDKNKLILSVVFVASLLILLQNYSIYQTNQQAILTTNNQQPSTVPQQTKAAEVIIQPQNQTVLSTQEETWTIENADLRLTFSAQGGSIIQSELLRYPETEVSSVKVLDPAFAYSAQSGIAGDDLPNHTHRFHLLNKTERSLMLISESVGGTQLIKQYQLAENGYVVDLKFVLQNASAKTIQTPFYFQLVRNSKQPPGTSQIYTTFHGPAYYTQEGKFQKLAFSNIEKGEQPKVATAENGWVAMVQHYFVSAWLPVTGKRSYFSRKIGDDLYAAGLLMESAAIAPGAEGVGSIQFYSGPSEEYKLAEIADGFDLVKDYGWFTLFAKPLFVVLSFFHSLTQNWGWAIALLTLSVKIVFLPLMAASYKSMARMKKVTPRIQELRERLKGDPKAMNQAMMNLYREEKLNPFGGCLPMIVQIPVFIALYWVLLSSVEIRNAPWLGWIIDLSVQDPYYVLPVLMTITMFIQVKLNPTPPDPIQAKMMWILPGVFSIWFFFFPAGLVLYWLVNNVLSIAQQWWITKKIIK